MSSQTRMHNGVVFIIAIAIVASIAYLYRPIAARNQQSMFDENVIVFDGACTIPQSQKPDTANGNVRLAFSCDGQDNEIRVFYINAIDVNGNYIIDHPGSKVHCKISRTGMATCDASTTSPRDP